eukprot:jgi/Botrbrau1/13935/Bobra.0193s0002.1
MQQNWPWFSAAGGRLPWMPAGEADNVDAEVTPRPHKNLRVLVGETNNFRNNSVANCLRNKQASAPPRCGVAPRSGSHP